MAILNYTTSIKTEKTASEIQKKLVAAGAQAVFYPNMMKMASCAPCHFGFKQKLANYSSGCP